MAENTISALTYNTMHGKGLESLDLLPNTDIMLFQEVPDNTIPTLTDRLKQRGYNFAKFAPAWRINGSNHQDGEATYYQDKLRLEKASIIDIGCSALEAKMFKSDGHRSALKTVFKDPRTGSMTVFVNAHLVLLALPGKRLEQIEKINSTLDSTPAVIVGDFNQTNLLPMFMGFSSFDHRLEELGFCGDKTPLNTHTYWIPVGEQGRIPLFQHRLDHAYTRGCQVVWSQALTEITTSDHFPVVFEIKNS